MRPRHLAWAITNTLEAPHAASYSELCNLRSATLRLDGAPLLDSGAPQHLLGVILFTQQSQVPYLTRSRGIFLCGRVAALIVGRLDGDRPGVLDFNCQLPRIFAVSPDFAMGQPVGA